VRVVRQLFRERIRQPGKPPHAHTHREVRPLRVAGADMGRVRLPVIVSLRAPTQSVGLFRMTRRQQASVIDL
jgi:hypothetical protein